MDTLTIFWSVMWKRTNNIHANEMKRKKKQPTNQQYQNKRSNNNNNDRTRKWSTNIIRSARAIWPWKLFFLLYLNIVITIISCVCGCCHLVTYIRQCMYDGDEWWRRAAATKWHSIFRCRKSIRRISNYIHPKNDFELK